MIEVEKKFRLNKNQLARIEKLAKFILKKKFTDVYFDNKEFNLTGKNIWLRRRNKIFGLKIPAVSKFAGKRVNSYKEIRGSGNIGKILRLRFLTKKFILNLNRNGYKPFCKITTVRKKYLYKSFTIDIDKVDFGYFLCEIEKSARSRKEVEKVGDAIIGMGRELGLKVNWRVRGKVLEYLWRYDKRHYNKLKESKIIL